MTTLMQRPTTTPNEILAYLDSLEHRIKMRFQKHGDSLHISSPETYGVIAEEFHELMLAHHDNDLPQFMKELEDIIVAGIFGYVSATRRIKVVEKH